MSISLMRKTAINLKSICEQLEFDRNISTNVYYDYDDECCLSVCDDNITYCLVVFNEKKFIDRGKRFMFTAQCKAIK